jgi:hypothetical protein
VQEAAKLLDELKVEESIGEYVAVFEQVRGLIFTSKAVLVS